MLDWVRGMLGCSAKKEEPQPTQPEPSSSLHLSYYLSPESLSDSERHERVLCEDVSDPREPVLVRPPPNTRGSHKPKIIAGIPKAPVDDVSPQKAAPAAPSQAPVETEAAVDGEEKSKVLCQ